MKAFVFEKYGLPNVLQLKEVVNPVPKANEVLVRVHSASINDWDWGLVRGKPFIIRMLYGLKKPKINIPGVDISGKIEAVGENVKKLNPGDEVYADLSESGFGGFAEYVCVPEHSLSKKPSNLSFNEAAALPHAALLSLQGLMDMGKIKSGQNILINGAGGGVGTLGIQIAKLYDTKVSGVDSKEKLTIMRSLGYDTVIDYKKEDFTKNGHKYDLILDTKTNRSTIKYARCLQKNGIYITVGGTMYRLFQIFLLGSLISVFSNKKLKVLSLKPNKNLAYITQLAENGKIKPLIDGPYGFEEIPKLIQHFGEGKHRGKIVVEIIK
ncbi:NAD(P)-dependent alcohol dehydrogenase [Sinomicrobium sp. M5D2P17]